MNEINLYENKYYTITQPFEPIYTESSRVLVLGSFPSVKTREYGFYYGHTQNRFWSVMENLFNEKISSDIDDRKSFLLKHKIAVYDSIYRCDIIGSSDASIKNVVPSDLSVIVRNADIRQVFCNGGVSYKYYKKYNAKLLGIDGIKLPSTSPANARFRLEDLLESWSEILEYLY